MTRAALAKIHIARKQLGLDEETYRDVLKRLTGRDSAAGLSGPMLEAVLAEFTRLGFKAAPPRKTAASSASLSGPYAAKLRALWFAAYNLGVIDDRSDAAIIAFVKRQTGLDHERWMRDGKDAAKVIEALKVMLVHDGGVTWTPAKVCRERGVGPVIAAKMDVLDACERRARALGIRDMVLADPNNGAALDAACARLGWLIREAQR